MLSSEEIIMTGLKRRAMSRPLSVLLQSSSDMRNSGRFSGSRIVVEVLE